MDRRHHVRFFDEVLGSYRLTDDAARCAFISDISATGCRLRHHGACLPIETAIEVHLDAVGTVCGTVIWSNDHAIGVHFQEPIDPQLLRGQGSNRL